MGFALPLALGLPLLTSETTRESRAEGTGLGAYERGAFAAVNLFPSFSPLAPFCSESLIHRSASFETAATLCAHLPQRKFASARD
jgi:hypothetical protein